MLHNPKAWTSSRLYLLFRSQSASLLFMTSSLALRLLDTLPKSTNTLFNPWADRCLHDHPTNGPQQRIERLERHLDCDPLLILIGEAPGFQGCRYSGLAFASERLILEGSLPRITPPRERLSTRRLPFSEPSATIIWKNLYRAGIQERCLLWNAIQMHPHKPGTPWSNRTPTHAELLSGQPALDLLRTNFPKALFVAVGRKAASLLQLTQIHATAELRHPANGGATQFALGLDRLLASL